MNSEIMPNIQSIAASVDLNNTTRQQCHSEDTFSALQMKKRNRGQGRLIFKCDQCNGIYCSSVYFKRHMLQEHDQRICNNAELKKYYFYYGDEGGGGKPADMTYDIVKN